MTTVINSIWGIILALSCLFYGVFASYYFSIVATIGDLKQIRNHKIKQMIAELMKDKMTNTIDLFFLIDDLNYNNKVWLLETDTDDNQSKFSLWLLGIVSVMAIIFFLCRSNFLSPKQVTTFNLVDFVFIALYFASLTWAVFTMYWEYIYYRPFFRHKQLMNKDVSEAYEVIKKELATTSN